MNQSGHPHRSDSTEIDAIQQQIWHALESKQYPDALVAVHALVDRGVFDDLAGLAIDEAIAHGLETAETVARLESLLVDVGNLPTLSRFQATWGLVRLTRDAWWDTTQRVRGVCDLFSAAAAAGAPAWSQLTQAGAIDLLVQIISSPEDRLFLLEQQSYAPVETGLSEIALVQIEELGTSHAADQQLARDVECLLHASRRPEAAYRVERARQRLQATRPSVAQSVNESSFKGMTVTIAGGHSGLQSRVRQDLLDGGAKAVRLIPTAQEANRSGREVASVVRGADLVVIVARQIAHSTSEQVQRAAARDAVPLVIADTAGLGSIRRAVERGLSRDPSGLTPSRGPT